MRNRNRIAVGVTGVRQSVRVVLTETIRVLVVAWIGLGLLGCQTTRRAEGSLVSSRKYPVQALHLLTLPVAVNLDQTAGADGFAVKIYASNPRVPQSLLIESGQLTILMYDGALSMHDRASVKPLRVWTYDEAGLRAHAYRSPLGVVYQFVLAWEDTPPRSTVITIVAEYTAPDGRKYVSAPATITTAVR